MTRDEAYKLASDFINDFEPKLRDLREQLKAGEFGMEIETTSDGFFDFYIRRIKPQQSR